MSELAGKNIAVIATNGYEASELNEPVKAAREAGADVVILAPEAGEISDKKGDTTAVDTTTAQARDTDFDGIILPGGTGNADQIRMDANAVAIVAKHHQAGKPIASICHAAWLLVEADAVNGTRVTSFPSLKTDLTNAGARWEDSEVVVDGGLITSRTPADLPAFNAAMITEFAK